MPFDKICVSCWTTTSRTRRWPRTGRDHWVCERCNADRPHQAPSSEPVTVQRRAAHAGVVLVCGQRVAVGRVHRHQAVTIHVAEFTLAIELDDGETRGRTGPPPCGRNIKADRPRAANVG